MASAQEHQLSLEEFKVLTERAGLDLGPQELEDLKPMYELYMQHVGLLREVDFKVEGVGGVFHADWPAT